MKTELTTEQSQHLFELGVPEINATILGKLYKRENDIWDYQRLFALTDLLEILPKEIYYYGDRYDFNIHHFRLYNEVDGEELWWASYGNLDGSFVGCKELIDALYRLLCWVIEDEYLKLD